MLAEYKIFNFTDSKDFDGWTQVDVESESSSLSVHDHTLEKPTRFRENVAYGLQAVTS